MINETSTVQELLFLKASSTLGLYETYRPRLPAGLQTAASLHAPRFQWSNAVAPDLETHPIENPFLTMLCCDRISTPAFNRPEASWRKMLITQPPLKRVGASFDRDRPPNHYVLITPRNSPPGKGPWCRGSLECPYGRSEDHRETNVCTPNPTLVPITAPNTGQSAHYVTLGDLDSTLGPSLEALSSWCLFKHFRTWEQLRSMARRPYERSQEEFLELELAEYEDPERWVPRRNFEESLRH